MPLPTASVSANPTFHFPPRPPMKIPMAAGGRELNLSSHIQCLRLQEGRQEVKAPRSHEKARDGTWQQESGRNQKEGWTHTLGSLLRGFLVKQKQLDNPDRTQVPARLRRVQCHVTHSAMINW